MKKIGFIGAYDKTDLILYVAKILTTLKKKVLVIDTTINQKARYTFSSNLDVLSFIGYVGVAAACIPASVYLVAYSFD